jgi:hypothetical protein
VNAGGKDGVKENLLLQTAFARKDLDIFLYLSRVYKASFAETNKDFRAELKPTFLLTAQPVVGILC